MGQVRVARMRHGATADQSRSRRGVVRRPEGPLAHEPVTAREQAGHAPQRGDLDGLLEDKGWKDCPEAAGLARPRRANINRLCPPAAAISSARLAQRWPNTAARSRPSASASAARPGAPGCRSRR